jgi:hypothetical protein
MVEERVALKDTKKVAKMAERMDGGRVERMAVLMAV